MDKNIWVDYDLISCDLSVSFLILSDLFPVINFLLHFVRDTGSLLSKYSTINL
jgi:hypothetical protein